MVQRTMRQAIAGVLFTIGMWTPVVCADRPNIVVIYTDDQGYGDVSCLNSEAKFQTPNIDRLAREGIVFSDGHCSDTVCTPSRYGLLTGRYSWRTELKRGVFGAERACLITDDRLTLASLVQSHGYRTAMVGKWHLGMDFPGTRGQRDWSQPVRDMPLDKGFDYFWGIPASMNYGVLAWFEGRHAQTPPTLFTRKKPNDLAIADYRIMPPYQARPEKPKDLEVAPDFVDHQCLTRFTDRAIAWIEKQAVAARNGNPFLLYLSCTSPHKPVIPIERFRGKSDAGAYGDFMMETDWHVGRLLEVLDREQLTENTLVFFSSDNGPETTWRKRIELYGHHSAGPYREGKRSIYEGGHRVPFIIRWPGRVRAGRSWDQPVCQTDLLATLAELLGNSPLSNDDLPNGAAEDSVSFFPVLINENARPARSPMIHHAANGRFAVREGKWKLVMETNKLGRELYDLAVDPGEERNLIDKSPEVVTKLVGRITAIVQNGRTRRGNPVPNDTPAWSDLIWMK
ncbi:MAG: arylsulfatase [Pirellulaceae bacterium]|nr:arylsulfatase [Pirellulaceae bacterium]HJN07339.1 arylsulfatase [Pirellulaceae bacterium]